MATPFEGPFLRKSEKHSGAVSKFSVAMNLAPKSLSASGRTIGAEEELCWWARYRHGGSDVLLRKWRG